MEVDERQPAVSDEAARIDGAILATLIAAVRKRGRRLGETESKAIYVALACARFLREAGQSLESREIIDTMYEALRRGTERRETVRSDLARAHQLVRSAFERWRKHQPIRGEQRDELLFALRLELGRIDKAFQGLTLDVLRAAFERHQRAAVGPNPATETLTALLAMECGALGAAPRARPGSGSGMGLAALRHAIEVAEARRAA
jgi:hypothetical protein